MKKKYNTKEEKHKGKLNNRKKYRENNKEKISNQGKNYRLKNREYLNGYFKKYYANLDEEKRIEALVRRLTLYKYGKAKICSLCNSKEKVEHHHLKPYNIDNFINLCKKCHEEVHKKND